MNTNNVSVNNSTVGVINTGTIESIQNALTIMKDSDAKDITSDVFMLIKLVQDEVSIEVAQRNEILERIAIIADEAAKPKPERRLSAVRAALGDASTLIGSAIGLTTLWDRYSGTIKTFFGIS